MWQASCGAVWSRTGRQSSRQGPSRWGMMGSWCQMQACPGSLPEQHKGMCCQKQDSAIDAALQQGGAAHAHLAILSNGQPGDRLNELEAHEGVLVVDGIHGVILVGLEVGHDEDGVAIRPPHVLGLSISNLQGGWQLNAL